MVGQEKNYKDYLSLICIYFSLVTFNRLKLCSSFIVAKRKNSNRCFELLRNSDGLRKSDVKLRRRPSIAFFISRSDSWSSSANMLSNSRLNFFSSIVRCSVPFTWSVSLEEAVKYILFIIRVLQKLLRHKQRNVHLQYIKYRSLQHPSNNMTFSNQIGLECCIFSKI